MLHEPPIDELAEKAGCKYSLCVVCSKRARQLIDNAANQGLTEVSGGEKPLSLAAKEIYDGKVVSAKY